MTAVKTERKEDNLVISLILPSSVIYCDGYVSFEIAFLAAIITLSQPTKVAQISHMSETADGSSTTVTVSQCNKGKMFVCPLFNETLQYQKHVCEYIINILYVINNK